MTNFKVKSSDETRAKLRNKVLSNLILTKGWEFKSQQLQIFKIHEKMGADLISGPYILGQGQIGNPGLIP